MPNHQATNFLEPSSPYGEPKPIPRHPRLRPEPDCEAREKGYCFRGYEYHRSCGWCKWEYNFQESRRPTLLAWDAVCLPPRFPFSSVFSIGGYNMVEWLERDVDRVL